MEEESLCLCEVGHLGPGDRVRGPREANMVSALTHMEREPQVKPGKSKRNGGLTGSMAAFGL